MSSPPAGPERRRSYDEDLLELLVTSRSTAEAIREVRQKQEETHATASKLALALEEHKTIERVDNMWATLGNILFTFKIVGVMSGAAFLLAVILEITHTLFRWPA